MQFSNLKSNILTNYSPNSIFAMKKEDAEFLRYSIRSKLVTIRLVSFIIIGLDFLVAYMALNNYAGRSLLTFSIFLVSIASLAIACIFFVLVIRRVYKFLKELKDLLT